MHLENTFRAPAATTAGRLCVLLAVLINPCTASSQPIIDRDEQMEVDWSNLRVRFSGEGELPLAQDATFKSAEQQARRDGLGKIGAPLTKYIKDKSQGLNLPETQIEQEAKKAADRVAQESRSINTTYYANGRVKVDFEMALGQVLKSAAAVTFKEQSSPDLAASPYTGVVLETDKAFGPQPVYEIADETGKTLFQASDVAAAAFEKNLMGRWFRKAKPAELNQAVGSNPLRLKATVDSNGKLVVPKGQWESTISGNEALMKSAKIAIVLP